MSYVYLNWFEQVFGSFIVHLAENLKARTLRFIMQAAKTSVVASLNNIPDVVELNVGGTYYVTSLTTLLNDPHSLLADMFSGKQKLPTDSRGRFFIDRDGIMFKFILDYLRTGNVVLPDKFSYTERLLSEVAYFKLHLMVAQIKQKSRADIENNAQTKGYITLIVRGTFGFGREGLADIKFRKLQRIFGLWKCLPCS